MDINQVNETIEELENRETTYDTCIKLASLYIVRDKLTKTGQNKEIIPHPNIFPQYNNYVENKRKYQLKEVSGECLYSCMNLLCLEISDFVHNLYSSCDTEEEKIELKNVISSLNSFLL